MGVAWSDEEGMKGWQLVVQVNGTECEWAAG